MADRADAGRGGPSTPSWTDVYETLGARGVDALSVDDCERLAVAAYLTGRDEQSAQAWEAAHHKHADAGDDAEAARCAFWLALGLLLAGKAARASGWLARAQRIVDERAGECAAAGLILIPALLGALDDGDATGAADLAIRATELGRRFGDTDLGALAILGHGQALIAMGDVAAGVARLDEAMVSATTGEVGPIPAGIVYCAVILECMRIFDLARATEWTEALAAWCDAQPDLVPYRGQCLVHRSQVAQAAGDWNEAMRTVEDACARLAAPPHPALGLAHYQRAELLRLRGDLPGAEDEFLEADRCGHPPQPGLALLELARGRTRAAHAAVRDALATTSTWIDRPPLLAAAVAVLRATGDQDGAAAAADELARLATAAGSPLLQAHAGHARGALLLDQDDPARALEHLRAAADGWRALRMPYEEARTAVLLAATRRALGDDRGAERDLDFARETFAALGAAVDLSTARGTDAAGRPGPLSPREREVLILVARGETNAQIAAELVISPNTVGRHLENIFAKLGVSSRAAATAHAYEHGLL